MLQATPSCGLEADEAREMEDKAVRSVHPKEASSYPVGVMKALKFLRREGSHDMYVLECSLWGRGGIWVMEVCKRAERLDPGHWQ